jgi:hypothetical protein
MPPGPTVLGPGSVAPSPRVRAFLTIALLAVPLSVAAQSSTGSEAWPDAEAHVQFPGSFRLLAQGQLKEGLSYDAQQWIVGGAIGYQWQRIVGRHVRNVDEDKEHHVVLGVAYQYLQTNEPKPQKDENRLVLIATLNFRPGERWLLGDQNRYEYRWVNGAYSTQYRNKIALDFDVSEHERPIRPYASAEFFYDVPKGDWSQEQYSAGLEWPVGHESTLQTYYLWQDCTSCSPRYLNVIGIGFSWFGRVR